MAKAKTKLPRTKDGEVDYEAAQDILTARVQRPYNRDELMKFVSLGEGPIRDHIRVMKSRLGQAKFEHKHEVYKKKIDQLDRLLELSGQFDQVVGAAADEGDS